MYWFAHLPTSSGPSLLAAAFLANLAATNGLRAGIFSFPERIQAQGSYFLTTACGVSSVKFSRAGNQRDAKRLTGASTQNRIKIVQCTGILVCVHVYWLCVAQSVARCRCNRRVKLVI